MRPHRLKVALLLCGAVAAEVSGTLLLGLSAGFTRPLPSIGVLAGYVVSILLFSRAVGEGIPLGAAYGTLTGCGLVSATLLGALLFGDPPGLAQVAGLVLIGAGVLALQTRRPEAGR
ncbi:QacE family quaternary ammonium compound efflux SMR transporter [Amycolatopsis acidicola]|uniref:QacE family quaternary ammonium compound efflux SMR transporter n=1 Tax=Amycolatopsis acidicola TaxID=2596893 RepID=A0A5N0VB64_9PSEU|nr:SMR family transporter [Amycolatopsis acidicola]KAA9163627.1 QacE family quaternary ammonium compound efflux SMR transporter [Amycolatopsis acidicola]